MSWIADQLSDYLTSSNTSGRFRSIANQTDDFYGVAVYDKLVQHYERETREQHEIDLRPLYLLWEHKKLMLHRMIFLEERGYLNKGGLTAPYTAVERKANNLLNLFIRSKLVNSSASNYELLGKLKELLARLKEEEEATLSRMLVQINDGVRQIQRQEMSDSAKKP
ncbi:hypothetical protein [Paenibacillus tarimensis]|uniref:hypothetical protein n=1 Tax=Paenibacillus tarimensis TaxID=416012 RepID=UPI001F1ACF9B|nr:hypothetical protein [Paenibacillus tarimensis]MCF2943484.1 hypothetical protein [Paenibacillus tarimensis]